MLSRLLSAARSKGLAPVACALVLGLAGCPMVDGPPPRDPTALKWFQRSKVALREGDVEEARDSVAKALSLAPQDEELRLLAAQVHLAMLDYAEAIKHLKGIKGPQAAGLRGRALWYKGDLEAAADALESMLNDPEVVDDWAKSIAKLARRGAGRSQFTISGGLLAVVEMPHVSPTAPYFVVPIEIDGEPALSLISTGYAEVVLDSATRAEPSWVSLRFGGRLEVQDVPALTQDLSGISKQINAPIKAILGVNVLRHVHATIDWGGRQFVARSFSPPPPPDSTRLPLFYAKGGGMMMKSSLGNKPASLLIDTSMALPISLDEDGWKKAGVDLKDLKLLPDDPEKKLKEGMIPLLKLGSSEITQVPGYLTGQVKQVEEKLSFDIDGMVGNGLLAYYRVTFGDGGRIMWLEDNLAVQRLLNGGQPSQQDQAPTNQGALPQQAPTVIMPDAKPPEPTPGKLVPPSGNMAPPSKSPGSSSTNPPPKTQSGGASKGP
jgi:tetratricopeptide (TPR) repeat protein